MKLSGFVAAIAAAFIALPALGLASAANAADPPKAPTKAQLEKGAKEGPPVIAAAGIQCTPDQILSKGKTVDPTTKKEVEVYEASCKEGLGYIVVQGVAGAKPVSFDCLVSNAAGATQACVLPGNADPKKGFAMRAAAAGRPCDVKDVAPIGSSKSTGEMFYELSCKGSPGFQMGLLGPKASFTECLALVGTAQACKLTTPEQSYAVLAPAVQASGKPCALKEPRYIGSSADASDNFYEISCQSGPGFMLNVTKDLAFKQAIDCGRAMGIGGGCKMTDVTVTQNADAGTYTNLARKAGYACEVANYRLIGVDKENREVVELACSNRPDGAVALFADPGKSEIFDCVMAGKLGQECKLSKSTVPFDKYTAALAAKGKGTCKVSDARFIGSSPTGDYVETACSDGLPGWVISLSPGGSVTDLLNCKQASTSGVPCKLPTNLKGNG